MTDKSDLIEQIIQTVIEHSKVYCPKDSQMQFSVGFEHEIGIDNREQCVKDIERLLDEPDEDELADETAEWDIEDRKTEQAIEEDQERRADLKRKYKE